MLDYKKSQIWVETVIYTLIGLTIIAVLMSAAMPQIDKMKDKETLKQTIIALNELNKKIVETREFPSNVRILDLKLSKGRLEVNADSHSNLTYILENSRLEFSQLDEKIKEGDIIIETKKSASRFNIFLYIDYNKTTSLTYNDQKSQGVLHPGAAPYKIIIKNTGEIRADGKPVIDIELD